MPVFMNESQFVCLIYYIWLSLGISPVFLFISFVLVFKTELLVSKLSKVHKTSWLVGLRVLQ